MKTSELIDKIAPALIAAQAKITFATKDATNPHFKNRYAKLPAVIDAVKPALNGAGIAFLQSPSPSDDGKLHLTTRLIHTSGQWVEDCAVCPLPKADPQGFGSAMTYLRRYSLASICGLYQDDDDGEGARHDDDGEGARHDTAAATVAAAAKVEALATHEQIKLLQGFYADAELCEKIDTAMAYYKLTADDFTKLNQKQAHSILTKAAATAKQPKP